MAIHIKRGTILYRQSFPKRFSVQILPNPFLYNTLLRLNVRMFLYHAEIFSSLLAFRFPYGDSVSQFSRNAHMDVVLS